MNTTFKKTLVASAILAFAGAANAATYTAGGNPATSTTAALTASAEGLSDAGLIQIGTAGGDDFPVVITNVVTNVEQDVLEITFSGATIITTGANASAPTMTGYDFFDIPNSNTIRFRVATGGVLINTATDLEGVNLVATGGAGSTVSISSRVISLNPVIGEYDKGTGKVLDVKAQTSVAVTNGFDSIISTVDNRKFFNETDSPDAVEDRDIVALTLTNNAAYEFALTVDDTTNAVVEHVIKGNFAYLLDADKAAFGGNANGALSSGEIATKVAASAVAVGGADTFAYALSADAQTLTITQTVVGDVDTAVTVNFDTFVNDLSADNLKAAATALSASAFAATITVETDDADFATATNAAVGEWKLDGSVVRVPYMVVGGGRFGVILNVTNSGSQTGEIFLDIYDEAGEPVAEGLIATEMASPNKIVSVAKDVGDALKAAGYNTTTTATKFSVVITTNVPEDDVQVYAAYTDNTTSERAIVNNDSKVQIK